MASVRRRCFLGLVFVLGIALGVGGDIDSFHVVCVVDVCRTGGRMGPQPENASRPCQRQSIASFQNRRGRRKKRQCPNVCLVLCFAVAPAHIDEDGLHCCRQCVGLLLVAHWFVLERIQLQLALEFHVWNGVSFVCLASGLVFNFGVVAFRGHDGAHTQSFRHGGVARVVDGGGGSVLQCKWVERRWQWCGQQWLRGQPCWVGQFERGTSHAKYL